MSVRPAFDPGNWLKKINDLADGVYKYTITVEKIGGGTESLDYNIEIDSQKPELLKTKIVQRDDGKKVLRTYIKDNHFLQGISYRRIERKTRRTT